MLPSKGKPNLDLTGVIAVTTVGYGEITPRSFLGRMVTVPLLVFGLLLIALPTFVLGREFSIVWDLMKEQQVRYNSALLIRPFSYVKGIIHRLRKKTL